MPVLLTARKLGRGPKRRQQSGKLVLVSLASRMAPSRATGACPTSGNCKAWSIMAGAVTGPALPEHHPFTGVVWENCYWSSTTENAGHPRPRLVRGISTSALRKPTTRTITILCGVCAAADEAGGWGYLIPDCSQRVAQAFQPVPARLNPHGRWAQNPPSRWTFTLKPALQKIAF